MNNTYEKILQAAYELIALNGFEKTSLNMIAKKVNIAKPSLYYYFTSKEELIETLFQILLEEMHFTKVHSINEFNKQNFKHKIIELGHKEIKAQKNDKYYSAILREYSNYTTRNNATQNGFIEVIDSYHKGFEKLIRHGIGLGVLPENTDHIICSEILVMVLNEIGSFISYGLEKDYERIWSKTVEALFNWSKPTDW